MKDTPQRELVVAGELGRMADARIKELEARNDALRAAAVSAAIPYEALLMDGESRKWIAPAVWEAIETAVNAPKARWTRFSTFSSTLPFIAATSYRSILICVSWTV